jgi:hypothetical protein
MPALEAGSTGRDWLLAMEPLIGIGNQGSHSQAATSPWTSILRGRESEVNADTA